MKLSRLVSKRTQKRREKQNARKRKKENAKKRKKTHATVLLKRYSAFPVDESII